ncbi:response regulator transcription factor [Nocardioides sp. ChNu-153]|uniref:response regulator n=1 Tax=Nocardioides sp. ChNu-153 TaxID=2779364 RepID=UPI00264D8FFA|nr:response regulator transcription factor [Nocardioides sp. ChNu-153]MDN7122113.1 response regulator transcription factor [Nocardioides sp. ChNu-153]
MSDTPTTSTGPVRVLLVDDQKLVRAGFALLFSVDQRLTVVGEAADGEAAVAAVAELAPDIVLMDIEMPRLNGIEATRRIAATSDAKVLMLTTFGDEERVLACLQAGAVGFLLKNTDPAHLTDAVLATAAGHSLLAPEVTRPVITRGLERSSTDQVAISPANQAALDQLTEREREVLRHVAHGRSNSEIAAELFVGPATVKTHVSACLAKLQLVNRVQLVVFAFESGFMAAGPD